MKKRKEGRRKWKKERNEKERRMSRTQIHIVWVIQSDLSWIWHAAVLLTWNRDRIYGFHLSVDVAICLATIDCT
jgi:hypothetical protein